MAKSIAKVLKNRNLFLDTFAILFGIGAWVAVNGIWVELPILVQNLPEQWSLPSYMTIVIQMANIGAILHGILQKVAPRIVNETTTTIVIMTIGTTACLLMVFFWDQTAVMNGQLHSIGFLTLVFFISLVDCTSSVVFIPFMAVFSETYLVSYFIGEGFSGFFPSVVALIQGVGGNPECVNMSVIVNQTTNQSEYQIMQMTPQPSFSLEIFFYVVFAFMCMSFAAFFVLRFYSWNPKWLSTPSLIKNANPLARHGQSPETTNQLDVTSSYRSLEEASSGYNSTVTLDKTFSTSSGSPSAHQHQDCQPKPTFNPKFADINFYLIILTWINFLMNGVLLSVQSYSCLPYGNLAYHLSVALSNAANPIACFLAFFVPNNNKFVIVIVTFFSTLVGTYILVLAVLSPVPPLVGTTAGVALVIVAWILVSGLTAHTKTSIAMLLHEKGNRALFWYGGVTQIGSFIGSLLMFLLVNVYSFFKSYNPCY